jgi:predicted nucleic acid-binding protein
LAEIVVADAGPLIAFRRLDKFSLLGAIFDRVIVPQAVYDETRSCPQTPDASAIRAAAQISSGGADAYINTSIGPLALQMVRPG